MSHHSRNLLKFGGLVAVTFVLGLLFAGVLDIPRSSLAQDPGQGGRGATITRVSAPTIPDARPLADLSEAFAAVAEAVRPSVVFVESERPARRTATTSRQVIPPGFEPFFQQPEGNPSRGQVERSSGSGFLVSAEGYILTNHHVIEGATEVMVRLLDGRSFPAEVVGSDPDTDVGVLKISAPALTPAALGSSDAVRVGEWVLAIGNPLGNSLTFSVTQGIVSAKGRGLDPLNRSNLDIQDFIQTDAAINRGNSGGPLVNVRGEVIGINSAIASETGFYAGYAFAVPIDLARAVMNQIITMGHVERTAMGVFVRTATPEDALYLGLDSIAGVKIDNFSTDDSPAKRAGLRAGDVITMVDGTPVKYVAQLQQVVGFRTPGETVRVAVARDEGIREFSVRLVGVDADSTRAHQAEQPADAAVPPPVDPETDNALGVAVEPITDAVIRERSLPRGTRGLLVKSVASRVSAAAHLCPVVGCARNGRLPDIITEIEGKPVRTEADYRAALAAGGRNGVLTVTVVTPLPADAEQQPSRIERIRLIVPE
jgi:serine protease Do